MRGDDGGQRRTLTAGRDRARVAVRHHVALARQHLRAEAADPRIDVALFGVDRIRFGEIITVGARQHAIDGIGEVHGRRPRFADALRCAVERGARMQLRR